MFYDRLCWLQVIVWLSFLSFRDGGGGGEVFVLFFVCFLGYSFKVSEWIGDWIILWGIAKSFHSFFRSLKANAKLLLLLLLFVAFFVLFVLFCFVVVVILLFFLLVFFFFFFFFFCMEGQTVEV